jgi:hypothetical protein
MFERADDRVGAAWTLTHEADAALEQSAHADAQRLYGAALTRFRELSDYWGIGGSLIGLGHLAIDRGDVAGATSRFREALDLFAHVKDRRNAARVLEALATVAAAEGDAVRAVTLAGGAAAVRQVVGVPPTPLEHAKLERALDSARLGPQAAAAATAWMTGWAMGLDELIAYARGGATT